MEKSACIAEISATVTGGYFSCSPCRSAPQICPARHVHVNICTDLQFLFSPA